MNQTQTKSTKIKQTQTLTMKPYQNQSKYSKSIIPAVAPQQGIRLTWVCAVIYELHKRRRGRWLDPCREITVGDFQQMCKQSAFSLRDWNPKAKAVGGKG